MTGSADHRHFDTILPMALAALLIVNSHLEAFYPRSWMAADGLLGNYLFFLLSALRMVGSRGLRDGFTTFLKNRILRIYPVVWIAAGFVFFYAGYPSTWARAIHVFIWPTDFTYIQLIMPFYAAFYWMHRWRAHISILSWCAALALFWILAVYWVRTPMRAFSDVPMTVHVADYFLAFLIGAVFQSDVRAREIKMSFPYLMLICLVYFTVKFVVFKMAWLDFYWLVHLLGVLAACALFLFLGRIQWQRWLPDSGVGFLASHSLEIYVIHSTLIRMTHLHELVFPVNVTLLVLITLILAWVLRKGMTKLAQSLTPIR